MLDRHDEHRSAPMPEPIRRCLKLQDAPRHITVRFDVFPGNRFMRANDAMLADLERSIGEGINQSEKKHGHRVHDFSVSIRRKEKSANDTDNASRDTNDSKDQ